MPKLSGSWKTPGSLFFYQTFFMLHVETYASIVHKEFTELQITSPKPKLWTKAEH